MERNQETLDVYLLFVKAFDVCREVSPSARFTLEQQLLGTDRFLANVKGIERAHKFENMDWEYGNIPIEKRGNIKRRIAALKEKHRETWCVSTKE